MTDYHRAPVRHTARKKHLCIYCGGPIPAGERYLVQTGFYEGLSYRSKFHEECFETLSEDGEFEFMPYSGEYPERVRLLMESGK